MNLIVVAPCYNEIAFVRAWLANVALFADRVILNDGGSTDGTVKVVGDLWCKRANWIEIWPDCQSADPQRDFWNESARRARLVRQAEEYARNIPDSYIVCLDLDEMLPDNFRQIAENCLDAKHQWATLKTHFWRSPVHVRVNAPGDPFWTPSYIPNIFPCGSLRIGTEVNHTQNLCELPCAIIPDCRKFHYHYLLAGRKVFENRPGAWEYRDIQADGDDDIRLRVEHVEHPAALRLIHETVNYGEWA